MPTLHVSGTMHIESAVTNWPDINNLLAFFQRATAAGLWQPVYSATLNVQPKTLTIVDTTDGIDEIEDWAAEYGTMSVVKWNTLSGTAAAWEAAGSLPSRVNP
jgi:hypothetical protein